MPRKKNDKVWKHFHCLSNKSATCNYCSKVYVFGNVNKMKAHLQKCVKCPLVIRKGLMDKENTPPLPILQPLNIEATAMNSSETQSDGNETVPRMSDFTNEKEQKLTKLLSKAIFVTGAPLSMVEHPLWKIFFEELQPLFCLPSRKAVSTTHLEAIYKEMEMEISQELKSANYLHLQCDGWSNVRNEGVINFIISKPEPFFVKSLHTGSHRHTSEYLRQEIEKVMKIYGRDKFVTLIGDNAKNVQKAFDLVRSSHPHLIAVSCAAHTLNLLCQDLMKPDAIQAFISIATATIKAVKKSQILSALLAQIVKDKELGEKLKLPCKTRWGSYFFALRSLLNNKAALQCLAVHEEAHMMPRETKTNLLEEQFWKMVEECTVLLGPITEQIFKLEGNKAHINDVYMSFKDIKSKLIFELPNLSTLVDDNIKKDIMRAVEIRKNMCIKPIHLAAYMLDPKTQGNELEEEEEIEAMELIHKIGRQMNLEVVPDLANYRAKEGFWAKSFVWSNLDNIDADIWWKGICKSRPLSKVAVRLLTAPCTSAATERSFSAHGNIHSLKRNRLTTERAAKLTYISYNWNLIHKNEIISDEEDEEVRSSPRGGSELSSPISMLEQPSTSRGPEPIEFLDIDCHNSEEDSDSD